MTILLYKDGKFIVDDEQPLEGVSLDNLAAILAGANDGDVVKYDATKGMWVSGAGGGSLPAVTASDKGKYLKANETTGDPEWASGSSGGGVLVVHTTASETVITLDKTFRQIEDGMMSGGVVIVDEAPGGAAVGISTVTGTYKESGVYEVSIPDGMYSADSEDGYPRRPL